MFQKRTFDDKWQRMPFLPPNQQCQGTERNSKVQTATREYQPSVSSFLYLPQDSRVKGHCYVYAGSVMPVHRPTKIQHVQPMAHVNLIQTHQGLNFTLTEPILYYNKLLLQPFLGRQCFSVSDSMKIFNHSLSATTSLCLAFINLLCYEPIYLP